jgi:hypothetical protein
MTENLFKDLTGMSHQEISAGAPYKSYVNQAQRDLEVARARKNPEKFRFRAPAPGFLFRILITPDSGSGFRIPDSGQD